MNDCKCLNFLASFIWRWRYLFGVVTSQFRVLIDDVSNFESLNMAPKGLKLIVRLRAVRGTLALVHVNTKRNNKI